MNNLTYTFSVEAFVPVLKSLAHVSTRAPNMRVRRKPIPTRSPMRALRRTCFRY